MNLFKKIKEAEEAKPATKKSFTKSIAVTAALLVVLTAASTAWITTAWFSMNRNVDSNGMSMDIEVSSNLVIAKSTTDITQWNWTGLEVSGWTNNFDKYLPATHATTTSPSTTNLKYCYNPEEVSLTTGLKKGTTELDLRDVPNAADSLYYRDYTVYIASTGKSFEASALTVSLKRVATGDSDNNPDPDYQMAATVDFYVNGVYAGKRALNDNQATHTIYSGTIPLNTATTSYSGHVDPDGANDATSRSTGYIEVLMRFYYDGALTKSGGTTAYINSAEVVANGLNLNVHFHADDAEP